MKLFVARHGQTEWNVQFRVCGRTDVELTVEGKAQAKKLAEKAKMQGIDLIISSPLKRARETSQAVADLCGVPIMIEDRLIEQDYGTFEGRSGKDPDFLANKRCFAYKYPGGESMMQVAYRVYGLLEEIKVKYAGKKVLLICHGGVCRVLHTYFQDMTNEEFFNYNLDNAVLQEYEL